MAQNTNSSEASQTRKAAQRRAVITRGLVYLLAVVMACWILLPIWLIGSQAFTARSGFFNFPKMFFPTPYSPETMDFFINATGVIDSMGRSVIVAAITVAVSLFVGAPAGYALARFAFPGRDFFRVIIVSTRSFPIVILAIPLAVTFIKLDLYDSVFSLAMMHVALALPFTVLVTSSVFAGVPRDLEEAAETLGCSPVQAFIRIVLPLVLPGLAAATLFTFVLSWNEVFASTILTLRNRTLPALLISQLDMAPLYYRYAGGFFLLLPSLFFMLFIRKYLFTLWGRVSR
ncbi:MAG TPA: carbohydrate ABC transporter permease [Thermoflexales bacterium]|nr:carbohydrate ABC transporter permease [Thermoflexales bacterium]HQW36565.1 carbohydrate ABC transporter permease [Thermoflexales bacterium]HQZ22581.1 carbohydrate ABC transporter permease [Thermoflexales bacterium]HQZ98998.1 carbohydrate ABC transporter permease [Thermoflexales bacterium]